MYQGYIRIAADRLDCPLVFWRVTTMASEYDAAPKRARKVRARNVTIPSPAPVAANIPRASSGKRASYKSHKVERPSKDAASVAGASDHLVKCRGNYKPVYGRMIAVEAGKLPLQDAGVYAVNNDAGECVGYHDDAVTALAHSKLIDGSVTVA